MASTGAILKHPPTRVRPLAWDCTPAGALALWPDDQPLAALVGAGRPSRARWSILARPTESRRLDAAAIDDAGVVDDLRRLFGARDPVSGVNEHGVPFVGGWIGFLAYELGEALEPAARAPGAAGSAGGGNVPWPAAEFFRCPGAYVHDGISGRWFAVGDLDAMPDLLRGRAGDSGAGYHVGPARSSMGRRAYERSVARTIEYIRAGDVFQVNVAHHLEAPFRGSSRAMFLDMLRVAAPWYGAYIECFGDRADGVGRVVCSTSPELFLGFDSSTRRIVTRPIKGTRAADTPASELAASEKDRAELVMIVDLMRNDLGRVCRVGSVRVAEPRRIETHGSGAGGVHHGVATVEGRLRAGLDAADLVAGAFPAGSITGAPKVRAMQIIRELESRPRGPYCGSIGYVSDCGGVALNVGIRTACVAGEPLGPGGRTTGVVRYGVGAGIVADSRPDLEWRETLHKAAGFLGAVGSSLEHGGD